MNRNKTVFSMTITFAALLATTLSCASGETETRTTIFDQYYVFEPTSLLESLQDEDVSALAAVKERPELLPVDQQAPVNWQQQDYFYIANALYERFLGKALIDWKLNSMDFRLGCSKIESGFQNGRLEFFNVVKEKEYESRISRFIDIDPRGNFIHVIEEKYYPNLVNLETIDLDQLIISAYQALQIAENNGGAQKRQDVGDACRIFLGLYPNSASYNGWAVSYTRTDNNLSIFYIEIDPYTGEIHFP